MNSCELTTAITVIANYLATKFNDDELVTLSTFFVQLGDTLATIATHRSICSNITEKQGNTIKNTEA